MDFIKKNYKKIIFLVIVPLFIAVLNIYIIFPIFKGEFNENISSIEVAFYTDAKFIYEHFPRLSWNPQWYLGFPFRNVYPPFLPFGIAFIHKLFQDLSFAQIYRILIGIFYIIGPITLYFFVRYLTRRNLAALFAGIGYSILPSFSYLIGDTAGYGELVNMGSLRLVVLQVFGEGPHLASLSLIPLAALLFLYALRNQGLKSRIIAAIGISLVALINWIGFVALVLVLFVVWLSEIVRGEASKKSKQAFFILLISYGLMAFWFNLTFLRASIGFGGGSRGEGDIVKNYLKILPILPILLPILVAIGWAISKKIKKLQGFLVGGLWFLIFFFIVISWYEWEIAYLPQPPRYIPELNMAAFIILGIILALIFRKITGQEKEKKKINKVRPVLGGIFVVLAILTMFYFSRSFLTKPRDVLNPHPDITRTYPYKIAQALSEKMDKNERVFATGNVAFWLNYFTDLQQTKGGADPASTHPWWDHAMYQVNTGQNAPRGKSGEMAYLWLKAINANYIVVNTVDSRDPFHDFKDPDKFINMFDEVYKNEGDIIYAVPLENPSLAQVVDEESFYYLEEPKGGVDFKRVRAYAEWVEDKDKSKASFDWQNNDQFEIEAEVKKGELISVQITYDKGWQVKSSGKVLKTAKDAIGNMVIFPRSSGKIKLTGEHKKTADVWLGYLITLTTITILVIQVVKERGQKSKKEVRTKTRKKSTR